MSQPPVLLHDLLYPRPVSQRFPAVPARDPLLVLKDTTSQLASKAAVAATAGTSTAHADHPDSFVAGRRVYAPMQVTTDEKGEPVLSRENDSLRDWMPLTTVLNLNVARVNQVLHGAGDAYLLMLEVTAGKSAEPLQRAVLKSVQDYTPLVFATSDAAADFYYKQVLRGNEPEYPGSLFARKGPFNNIHDIARYARHSDDFARCFQILADIALHVWCLVRGRFLQYLPGPRQTFSALHPDYLRVFFRDDFNGRPASDLVTKDDKTGWSDFKIDDDTRERLVEDRLDFFQVASRASAAAFVSVVLEYIIVKHTGVVHSENPCCETKSCAHSQFKNLCSLDWPNLMRTLRYRQAPITGWPDYVVHRMQTAAGLPLQRRPLMAAATASDTPLQQQQQQQQSLAQVASAVHWTSRSITTAPKIDMLHLKLTADGKSVATGAAAVGPEGAEGHKATTTTKKKKNKNKNKTSEQKQTKKPRATGIEASAEVKQILDLTQPFAFHSLLLSPHRATLDTSGLPPLPQDKDRGGIAAATTTAAAAAAGKRWMEAMLLLLDTMGTRSGRSVASVRHQVRLLTAAAATAAGAAGASEASSKNKKNKETKAAAVALPPLTTLEPWVSEARLVYSFALHDSGCLRLRSPVPPNMLDICTRPRDLLSPCNMSSAAWFWLINTGTDALFSDQGIQDALLRDNVHLATNHPDGSPPSNFPDLLFVLQQPQQQQQQQPFRGIFCNPYAFNAWTRLILDQHKQELELTADFGERLMTQPFVRLFSDDDLDAELMLAWRLYTLYLALCCLIKNEADVVRTLAMRMCTDFFDEKTNETDFERMLRLLQLGDHVYRFRLVYLAVRARRVMPCLVLPADSAYARDTRNATAVFQQPGRGLLHPNALEDLGQWVEKQVQPELVLENPGLALWLAKRNNTTDFRPLCHRALTAEIHAALQDVFGIPSAVPAGVRTEDPLGIRDVADHKFLALLPCTYYLPEVTPAGFIAGGHMPTFGLRQAMVQQAIAHIVRFVRTQVVFPLLQYYAIATQPINQVQYTYRDIVNASQRQTTVPWTILAERCRTSPLERELDRILQELRVSANAIASHYGYEATPGSIIDLFQAQSHIIHRLSPARFVPFTALVDCMAQASSTTDSALFEAKLDRFTKQVSAARLQLRRADPAVVVASVAAVPVASPKDKMDETADPPASVPASAPAAASVAAPAPLAPSVPVLATVATPPAITTTTLEGKEDDDEEDDAHMLAATSHRHGKFTQLQATRAQLLLLELQKPGAWITPKLLEQVTNDLVQDPDRDIGLGMPTHALDLLHAAFRRFYDDIMQAVPRLQIRRALQATLDKPRTGLGSREHAIDSLSLAAVRRLLEIAMTLSQPSPLPPATAVATAGTATATSGIAKPVVARPVSAMVAAVAIAPPPSPSSPVPPAQPQASAVLLEPVRVVNQVLVTSSAPYNNDEEADYSEPTPPPSPPSSPRASPAKEKETESLSVMDLVADTNDDDDNNNNNKENEPVAEPTASAERTRTPSPPPRPSPSRQRRLMSKSPVRRRSRSRERAPLPLALPPPPPPRTNGYRSRSPLPTPPMRRRSRSRSRSPLRARDLNRDQLREHLRDRIDRKRDYGLKRRERPRFYSNGR